MIAMAFKLPAKRTILGEQFTVADGVSYSLQEIFVNERFRDVVVGSLAKCCDGGVDGGEGGHHDNERVFVDRLDSIEKSEAVEARHFDVRNGDVDPVFG